MIFQLILRIIIPLLPKYYQKSTCKKNIKHNDKPITTISDFGKASETCHEAELD